jgi:hypothetical protein
MIPIGPDGTPAPEQPVDGLRHADGQPLTATREHGMAVRLDQEMQEVGLDAEVQQAK